ncbi:MAG: DNRLRE domain-containing protein [Phycisphaerales bacterium]
MRCTMAALGAGAVLLAAAGSPADVVTLGASRDTTIFLDLPSNSNGAGPGFHCGANNLPAVRRALIAFDIAGAVPAGATIDSVTLRLNMSSLQTALSTVSLHTVAGAWGEGASNAGPSGGTGAPAQPGDATWLDRVFGVTPWASAGGDFNPLASAAIPVTSAGLYTWTTPLMGADVQAWLDAPGSADGWLLMGTETTAQTAKRFDSREHSNPALRPALEVHYTPIPAPGALALAGLAGALAAGRWRR